MAMNTTTKKGSKMAKSAFLKWFETFLEEKNLPYICWDIEGPWGLHVIDSDVVIEAIKGAPAHEQRGIKAMIVKIDFLNGDVLDFFKHLAQALANNF